MKTRYVVGLDLDGTLINSKQKLTIRNFKNLLRNFQDLGFMFVLNSDSALESLQFWQDKLGIDVTSPIIAEKGSVLRINGQTRCTDGSSIFFEELKETCIRTIAKEVPKDWLIMLGDTSLFPIQKIDMRSKLSRVLVVINRYRISSLSFDLRKVATDGTITYCPQETQQLYMLLKNLIVRNDLIVNPDPKSKSYFSVTLAGQNNNKTKAFVELIKEFGLNIKYYMIGNEPMDYIEDTRVRCACVQNTGMNDKRLFAYTAKSAYTKGVVEVVEKISSNSF